MCLNSKQTKSPISLKCLCTEKSEFDIERKDAEGIRCVWYTHTPKITAVGAARRPKLRQGAAVLFYLPANQIERWLSCERQARWHLHTSPPTDSSPSFSSQHCKLSSGPPTTPAHPRPPPRTLTQLLVFLLIYHPSSKALFFPREKLLWTLNTSQDSVFGKCHYSERLSCLGSYSSVMKLSLDRWPNTPDATHLWWRVLPMYLCLYVNPGSLV